ncbi:restriction endonuclease subunit S [Kitasatospora cinereorecta]
MDRWAISIGPFGSKVTTRDYRNDGVPFIRGVNLARGIFVDSGFVFIDENKADEVESAVALPGDLVFTRKGTVGQVSMIPRSSRYARYVISGSQVKVRLNEANAVPEFYYYWFASDLGRRSILEHAVTTGVPSLANSLASIRGLAVPCPPVGEQRAIAEVLGALDDKIALNERICVTGLDLGDSYHQVVVDHGGPAQCATFGQLMAEGSLQFGDGYRTKKAEHGTPGLPILRVAEVGEGRITPSFGDHVREEFRSAMGSKTSRSGDVVLTTKGTVGRVALISPYDEEFVYSPQVCFFRPAGDGPISAPFLFHWLRGQEFWRQAAGMKGQTDMADYLSLSDIRSLKISLPTESALAAFDRRCGPLHARAEAARLENRTLADLRDTLLPQLVTGKLRVRDAARIVEDEV